MKVGMTLAAMFDTPNKAVTIMDDLAISSETLNGSWDANVFKIMAPKARAIETLVRFWT